MTYSTQFSHTQYMKIVTEFSFEQIKFTKFLGMKNSIANIQTVTYVILYVIEKTVKRLTITVFIMEFLTLTTFPKCIAITLEFNTAR